MSSVSNGSGVPDCDAECGELVRELLRQEGIDAHVTHVPPLIASPYMDLDMTCPHGIKWHTAPTSEQMAEFARSETR